MAEVLSQSQIDSLLDSLQMKDSDGPKVEQKKYRKYDFYSPKKFTKDKLKLLQGIHDNYARMTASQMNSLFRVSSEIEVVTVEEQRYYEFANALYETDIMTLIDVSLPNQAINPPIMLHTSTSIITSLIDRMLGGMGDDGLNVPDDYAYTDIELVLYQRIVQYLITPMKDAWGGYINMDFNFSRVENNISMFQDVGVDETVVIIVLKVNLKEISGKINICIPGNLLSMIFKRIEKRKHISKEKEDGSDGVDIQQSILTSIKDSTLDLSVELGRVEIDLSDIYGLHVGDIIDLNKSKDTDVVMYIEEEPWFTGKLGVHKKNVAVQIEDRIVEKR